MNVTIRELCDHWRHNVIPPTITLTVENDQGETIIIASPAQICWMLEKKYGSLTYHCYPQFDTIESCGVEFQRDWGYEAEIYSVMIQKWHDVLNTEYDPLSNYDRKETSKNWGGVTTNQRTHNNDRIETSGGKHIIDYDTATYESSVKNRETVTDDRTDSSYTDHTGGYTDTETQTEQNAAHTDSRITGNIGVTTSQQMAESELSLRQFNILADFIALFLRHHCYSTGVCEL